MVAASRNRTARLLLLAEEPFEEGFDRVEFGWSVASGTRTHDLLGELLDGAGLRTPQELGVTEQRDDFAGHALTLEAR